MPTAQVTPSLTGSIESLDHGLPLVAVDEVPASGPTFFVPGARKASLWRRKRGTENSAPPIGFMLIMLLVGASAAAIVFHTRISQIW